MSSFDERLKLTETIENSMNTLFDDKDVVVHEFGCKSIVKDNAILFDYIRRPEANQQASAMIVKFAPDFILLKNSCPGQLYFIDIKHSVSPIWAPSRLKMLQEKNGDTALSTSRIGVVAREALLAYRRFYPNSIILMASPYNSKLLMAQFADKVRCLYCYHADARADYDCEHCPSKNGGFFDIERATDSVGSQTPMTDVDLDSFLPADTFFEKIGVNLNRSELTRLKDEIKKESIEFGGNVYPALKNTALWNLNRSGCDWVEYELYSTSDNDFYHIDKKCKWIKWKADRLVTYPSVAQALNDGKRACRTCCTGS